VGGHGLFGQAGIKSTAIDGGSDNRPHRLAADPGHGLVHGLNAGIGWCTLRGERLKP